MNQRQLIDSRGPVTNIREERLVVNVDPAGIDRYVDYEFSLVIGCLWETSSTAKVVFGDEVIKEGPSYNDFYGFGRSVDDLPDWAQHQREKFGPAFTVVVETTVQASQIFFSDKPAFYVRAVQYCSVDPRWRRAKDGAVFRPNTEVLTIWKDGEFTADHARLLEMISDLTAADEAGDRRTRK